MTLDEAFAVMVPFTEADYENCDRVFRFQDAWEWSQNCGECVPFPFTWRRSGLRYVDEVGRDYLVRHDAPEKDNRRLAERLNEEWWARR